MVKKEIWRICGRREGGATSEARPRKGGDSCQRGRESAADYSASHRMRSFNRADSQGGSVCLSSSGPGSEPVLWAADSQGGVKCADRGVPLAPRDVAELIRDSSSSSWPDFQPQTLLCPVLQWFYFKSFKFTV
jgi:hypothetical protein